MNTQLLNGVWDFALIPDYDTEPVYNTVATVPGCFDTRPGEFGERKIGCYRKEVTVAGGKVMLTVAGCGIHSEIFWDGVSVGKSVLPYTREEYIFDSGVPGKHILTIKVDNFITDDPGEQFKNFYDFYAFGGIYSDITLTEFADDDIRYIEVIPQSYETGEVKIKVEPFVTAPAALKIAFDGKAEKEMPYTGEFSCIVPDFKLWSPEEPNLHTVTINGKTVSFGIRILDWSSQEFKLNGKPLKLVGCNRHESHPQFGAATPENLILNDLLLIKKEGFNFIRGSHYPQKETMLELCDKIGLLVWEEALGWGNKPPELGDENFIARQEEQCRKMVRKSINHPCVIIWGFLNECASDHENARVIISKLREAIKALDTSRPVTFATNRPRRDICFDLVDILTINIYPGWYDVDCKPDGIGEILPTLEEFAEQFKDVPKPLIVSEIGAAAIYGDHSGYRWSEPYQARLLKTVVTGILENKRYTGVALWLFCDANTYIETVHFFNRPRGFNNKGMLNEYRKPKVAWNQLHELLIKQNFIK